MMIDLFLDFCGDVLAEGVEFCKYKIQYACLFLFVYGGIISFAKRVHSFIHIILYCNVR